MEKIKVGVSSCLLGEQVRFDGGHKRDRLVTEILGEYFEYVPVCPEVELGLPTPRETLRLISKEGGERLVFSKSGDDITDSMTAWARMRVGELEKDQLYGFIFKSKSPSSGMERVKLYDKNGSPTNIGVGVFARVFMEHFPLIPVEEDGRLHDAKLRENFIECVFTFKRWGEVVAAQRFSGLVEFHTRHKLLLMAHNMEILRQMGKIVAAGKELPVEEAFLRYQELLMKTMRLKPTVKKHINVLDHVQGYFKKQLSVDEKQELKEVFDHYRQSLVPLIVPITMLNHYVRKYDQPYLQQQYYLNPHPLELKLRNHV